MNARDQAVFAQALGRPEDAIPWQLGNLTEQRFVQRFNIARNTVHAGRIEALRQVYPAVERLLGADYFTALAALFSSQHPPCSAVLHEYGENLAAFIEQFPPLVAWPFLADVARLEWARLQAFHAADALPLQLDGLGEEALHRLLDVRLQWHPSVTLLRSAYPLRALWSGVKMPRAKGAGENALVWRQGLQLMTRTMDNGSADLLEQLQCLGSFSEAALVLQQQTDIAQLCSRFSMFLGWQVLSAPER